MAHPLRVKAQAMAMLITGDTVTYVAKVTGVPKQTISRWKVDADRLLREIVKSSPALQAIGRQWGPIARKVLQGSRLSRRAWSRR